MPSLVGALAVPADRSSRPDDVLRFASLFRPVRAIGVAKRRIGAEADGGYVMLDDLPAPCIALSLGVGEETSWDRHMADLGAVVDQYDHTVREPASLPPTIRFHGQRIVPVADGSGVTVEDALAALEAIQAGGRAVLKIDIEGDEWSVLDAIPDTVLERFDQIVGEYHDFEHAGDAAWVERASRVMRKLDRLFRVVHVHANNHRPLMLIDGKPFPWVLEVTHASRKRYAFEEARERFPTYLDCPNHPDRPDFRLGRFAFGGDPTEIPSRPVDRPLPPPRNGMSPPVVSHARNGEDVVLHRALKEVEVGHYVDVGAHDPETVSVTKIFYDRGWSGINVEACKDRFERFVVGRPRDRNLHVAAAARAGLARFSDGSAMDARASGDRPGAGADETGIDVPALSLADICRDVGTTHFLRIGVGDAEVLLGADFEVFRPWIVIVAAGDASTTDAGWRRLQDAGYDRTLFDGVNLWFLAREQAHLRDRLEAPANVRDDYVSVRLDRAETALVDLREQLAGSKRDERELDGTLAALVGERGETEDSLQVYRSHVAMLESLRDRQGEELRRLTQEGDAQAHRSLEDLNLEMQRSISQHALEIEKMSEDVFESRVKLRLVEEKCEAMGRELRLKDELYKAGMDECQNQLTRLAHFRAQSALLQQISDLTGAGSHLEERGAELVVLRAGLLDQANAWQSDVEMLQSRLDAAMARSDLMQASTSWRVTSPLRGLGRATHVLRREPHRLPRLMRQRARAMLGHQGVPDLPGEAAAGGPQPSAAEGGTRALVSVAARLDGEMALIADLLGSVSSVLGDGARDAAGPSYNEARLDERLTRWILADVVRQRRAAL